MRQVYKMTNGTMLENFEQLSPVVYDMDEAIKYFREQFPVEFPGCSIVQVDGVKPEYGPNFLANTVWATPEEASAFRRKYGYVPMCWDIHTESEQEAFMKAEWEKEERKSSYM